MEALVNLAGKFIGALGGAFTAIAFTPPANRREFMRRGSGSVVFGVVMAPVVKSFFTEQLKFNWPPGLEGLIAAAAVAALFAWPLIALITWLISSRQGNGR